MVRSVGEDEFEPMTNLAVDSIVSVCRLTNKKWEEGQQELPKGDWDDCKEYKKRRNQQNTYLLMQ